MDPKTAVTKACGTSKCAVTTCSKDHMQAKLSSAVQENCRWLSMHATRLVCCAQIKAFIHQYVLQALLCLQANAEDKTLQASASIVNCCTPQLHARSSHVLATHSMCEGLLAGRVTVHPIRDAGREESEGTFQVPSQGAPGNVTCLALSAHFLVLGTATGMLLYYQCHDKALLNEFRHQDGAITKVFPQPYGTRYHILTELSL